MKNYTLGKSGIELSPLGLGCWQFSQGVGLVGKVWDSLSQSTMTEIVKTALDQGVNWFDTAEVYGKGKSEQSLSAALSSLGIKPGSVVVATKWFPFFRSAGSLISTFPERERMLSPYPIDLLQIHMPTSFSSKEKQAMALVSLVKEKKVHSVGVSNFSAKDMRTVSRILEAEGLCLASNQVRYNLADRDIDKNGILEAAKELGISLIAYSPLAQGLLTGRFHSDPLAAKKVNAFRRIRNSLDEKGLARSRPLIEALQEIAAKHNATPAQVSLNWLVTFHGTAVVAIPGASKPSQAEDSFKALNFVLTKEELYALDEISRNQFM